MNAQDVVEFVTAAKAAVDTIRGVRSLIPSGPKREELDRQLAQAERAVSLSNAAAAKALGGHLCHCTFPPQIMLSKGYHPTHGRKEVFVCPACDKQDPSPAYFANLDAVKQHNDSLPPAGYGRDDWMR